MYKANFFVKKENNTVICELCPKKCLILEGKNGFCGVRGNRKGELYSLNYGIISAANLDPIEKKPLYHFYPGKKILSIGSYGCNFRCLYCQNYEISQKEYFNLDENNTDFNIDKLVQYALEEVKNGNIGIAYTYNEPIIWYEFMYDISKKISNVGLKNVMVSNGFIEKEPLLKIIDYIDAFNIDLKGFSEKFYKNIISGELKPVLENIVTIKKNKKHLEITFLVIPDENDNIQEFKNMCKWLKENCGDIILHVSKYFPRYKMTKSPTSENKISELILVAKEYFKYVYSGNSSIINDTICFNCNKKLIKRIGYSVEILDLTDDGRCINCGEKIVMR